MTTKRTTNDNSTMESKEEMAAGHTPGPWRINNNIGKKSELGITADSAPCVIATMANTHDWPLEARANARLIASAPEMLSALKIALLYAREAMPADERKLFDEEGFGPTWMFTVKDAIARAEGRN